MSRLPRLLAVVRDADVLGYEAAFIGAGAHEADPMVRAAAALQATQRIRVGPGVVNAQEHHPAALARAAAGLDRLAPGRALLGVGRGDPAELERSLRLPAALAGAALEDTLRICGPLLRGRPVAWHGRRWSAVIQRVYGDATPAHPVPLICAAVGAWTLRLAGALATGVILNYGASPEYVRWAVERVAEGAAAAGRDPSEVDILGIVLVARTDAAAADRDLRQVRSILEFVLAIPDQARALTAPIGGIPDPLDEASLRRLAAVGTLAEIRARLDEYRHAGLRCPVLLPSGMYALGAAGDHEDPRV